MPLETEARAEIRSLISDLEPDDGKLLDALHRVQHRYGYLSNEALEVIAEHLEMFPSHVYGAASFYDEYRFTPPASTTIRWCSGPACRLENSNGIRDAMLAIFKLKELGDRTDDNQYHDDAFKDFGCHILPLWLLFRCDTTSLATIKPWSWSLSVAVGFSFSGFFHCLR